MGASTHNVYRWVVHHRNVGLTVVGFEQLPRWRDIAGFEQSGYIGTLDFGDRRAVGERTQHGHRRGIDRRVRSEEHTSELQSLMRISYAVFCLKKKKIKKNISNTCGVVMIKQKNNKNNEIP